MAARALELSGLVNTRGERVCARRARADGARWGQLGVGTGESGVVWCAVSSSSPSRPPPFYGRKHRPHAEAALHFPRNFLLLRESEHRRVAECGRAVHSD